MSWRQTVKNNFSHLLHLIYPNTCAGCKNTLLQSEQYVCNLCLNELVVYQRSNEDINSIKNRIATSHLDNLYFLFWFSKKGLGQTVINDVKYFNNDQLGFYLGQLLGKRLPQGLFDLLIPTPIHHTKLKKRGYNQTFMIAKGVQSVLNIPIDQHYLSKKVNTGSQTKKSRKERWQNASVMFERLKELDDQKHLLLIDDVLTSGATTSHCIQVIEPKHRISIATLAVAKELY